MTIKDPAEDTQRARASIGPAISIAPSGALSIDGCDVTDIVARYGTPVWVVADAAVRANLAEITGAFARQYPSVRVVYASKANPEPAILQIVRQEGALVDVVTAGHLSLAAMGGFEPKDIVFNGNSKTLDELSWAISHGVGMINVDSLAELGAIADLVRVHKRQVNLAFRLALNPSEFEAGDAVLAAQIRDSKFGMPADDVLVASEAALKSRWLRVVGVHSHLGFTAYGDVSYSREAELERRRIQVRQMMSLVGSLKSELAITTTVLNLGGGFRRGRAEGYGPGRRRSFASIDETARVIAQEIRSTADQSRLKLPTLMLEAGGYVVSDAVTFLATVGFTKSIRHGHDQRDWAFLEDTSAYHFVRRLLSDFYHHPILANRPEEPPAGLISIAGATCAPDTVAADVPFPRVGRGDLVALLDQGAYCESISSDYCAIPIPAVVLARDGQAFLVSRRESAQEATSGVMLPPAR